MPKLSGLELPIRAPQHVADTAAVLLFKNSLPKDWVVRELSERDYGIDALVEITSGERMTGNVIAAQLKGDSRLTLRKRESKLFRRLKRSTYKYLLGLPTPSYLFVCAVAEQQVYWASLNQRERERGEDDTGAPAVWLHRDQDLSEVGQLVLWASILLERRWPAVEAAIVGALMAFNSLGPLYLACKRAAPSEPAPSTVQFLLIQHYEFNALLQRYVMQSQAKPAALRDIYDRAVETGGLTATGVFTVGFVTEVFREFIFAYCDAIEACFHMVTQKQRAYWWTKYPYLLFHLTTYPPVFNEEDWAARYYFDEYERETRHINLAHFADLDEDTRSAYIP